jgi:hypothetical protein
VGKSTPNQIQIVVGLVVLVEKQFVECVDMQEKNGMIVLMEMTKTSIGVVGNAQNVVFVDAQCVFKMRTPIYFTLRDFSLRENHLAGYPSSYREHNKMLNGSLHCISFTKLANAKPNALTAEGS